MADSGLPWTTLRATQFHDLIFMVIRQLAKLPVIPVVSGFKFQPIDAGDVADQLVALAPERAGGRRTSEDFLAERESALRR